LYHGDVSYNIALGLKELRSRIAKAAIPPSKIDETLNIATWNIREFGKKPRKETSIHFIAEILGRFDLIAVVELRDNLTDLSKVMRILGPYWRVVYSDFIEDPGGNRERMAYLYDQRAVAFTGLASEADPPRKKNAKTGEYESLITWWRSPYIASFKSGDFDFVLITAHIRWGDNEQDRIKELQLLAEWVERRCKEATVEDKDIIVMGDFNIPEVDDDFYKTITSKGLRVPDALRGVTHGSNLEKDKRYDQILHYPKYTKCFTNRAGVLDFYEGGIDRLYPREKLSKHDFTFELSDHLPLWIQIDTDTDAEKIDQILATKKPG